MTEHERKVGLGHVVDDRLSTGSPDEDDPGGLAGAMGDAADANATRSGTRPVEDDSADSFPASDPPAFMSDPPAMRAPGSGDEEPA